MCGLVNSALISEIIAFKISSAPWTRVVIEILMAFDEEHCKGLWLDGISLDEVEIEVAEYCNASSKLSACGGRDQLSSRSDFCTCLPGSYADIWMGRT
jgi:hypothetical protein